MAARGTKVIALSVDSVEEHKRWASDIEETQGTAPNYPIIGDTDRADDMLACLTATYESVVVSRTPSGR